MQQVTVEILERLVDPFRHTAVQLYFTRHENRVYVGRTPAQKIAGSDAAPNNLTFNVEQLTSDVLTSVAQALNEMEARRVQASTT
jgi:hypothetical protein